MQRIPARNISKRVLIETSDRIPDTRPTPHGSNTTTHCCARLVSHARSGSRTRPKFIVPVPSQTRWQRTTTPVDNDTYVCQTRATASVTIISAGSPIIVQIHQPSCWLCRKSFFAARQDLDTKALEYSIPDIVYRCLCAQSAHPCIHQSWNNSCPRRIPC